MKTAIKLVLGMIAAVCLSAGNAHATLIDFGATTVDTATGLAWLDLTQTTGMTYNEFLNNVGGFYAEGWRSASWDQLEGVLATYLSEAGPDGANRSLWGLFGTTRFDDGPDYNVYVTSGYFAGNTGDAIIYWMDIVCRVGPCPDGVPEGTILGSSVSVRAFAASIDPDSGNYAHGYWLVRPTPEPSTLALMGVGVLAVFRKARRRA